MIVELTDIEYDDAANALMEWFKSQDLNPTNGTIVMIKLIATQLVARTTDYDDLAKAIVNIKTLLSMEVCKELGNRA